MIYLITFAFVACIIFTTWAIAEIFISGPIIFQATSVDFKPNLEPGKISVMECSATVENPSDELLKACGFSQAEMEVNTIGDFGKDFKRIHGGFYGKKKDGV